MPYVEESAHRKLDRFHRAGSRNLKPVHHEALSLERVHELLGHHREMRFRLDLPTGRNLLEQIRRVRVGQHFAVGIGQPRTELRLQIYERGVDGFWRYEFRLVISAERPEVELRAPRSLADDDPLLTRYRWRNDEGSRGVCRGR
jgi:hypothetical protein